MHYKIKILMFSLGSFYLDMFLSFLIAPRCSAFMICFCLKCLKCDMVSLLDTLRYSK